MGARQVPSCRAGAELIECQCGGHLVQKPLQWSVSPEGGRYAVEHRSATKSCARVSKQDRQNHNKGTLS